MTILSHLPLHLNFTIFCRYPYDNFLGFSLGLHQMCRLSWEELSLNSFEILNHEHGISLQLFNSSLNLFFQILYLSSDSIVHILSASPLHSLWRSGRRVKRENSWRVAYGVLWKKSPPNIVHSFIHILLPPRCLAPCSSYEAEVHVRKKRKWALVSTW